MFKNKLENLMKHVTTSHDAINVLCLVENCSKYIRAKADIEVRTMFLNACYGENNVTSRQYMEFIGPNEKELQDTHFAIAVGMNRLNVQYVALFGEEIFPNFRDYTILELYIKSISDEFYNSES